MFGSLFGKTAQNTVKVAGETPASGNQDEKNIPRKTIYIESEFFLAFKGILEKHGSLGSYFEGKNIRIHSSSACDLYYYHMDKGVFKTGKFDETGDMREEILMSERIFFGLQEIHGKGNLEGKNICEKTLSPHPYDYYRVENGKVEHGYFEEQGSIQRPTIMNGPS